MNLANIEKLLASKKQVTFDFPFNENVKVFRVSNKIFALIDIKKEPLSVNLKCEPNNAIALRDIYKSVIPGYHMNKKHWNTVILDDTIPLINLKDMIDESYELVFKKLTKEQKNKLLKS